VTHRTGRSLGAVRRLQVPVAYREYIIVAVGRDLIFNASANSEEQTNRRTQLTRLCVVVVIFFVLILLNNNNNNNNTQFYRFIMSTAR